MPLTATISRKHYFNVRLNSSTPINETVVLAKMCAGGRYVKTEPSGHKRRQTPNPEIIRTCLPYTPMCHEVPLLPAGFGLQASKSPWPPGYGCRCFEPSDVRLALARSMSSALSTMLRRGQLRNLGTPQGQLRNQATLATCRYLFVVLGTSIRVFRTYSKKQRPAQHLHLVHIPKDRMNHR